MNKEAILDNVMISVGVLGILAGAVGAVAISKLGYDHFKYSRIIEKRGRGIGDDTVPLHTIIKESEDKKKKDLMVFGISTSIMVISLIVLQVIDKKLDMDLKNLKF